MGKCGDDVIEGKPSKSLLVKSVESALKSLQRLKSVQNENVVSMDSILDQLKYL